MEELIRAGLHWRILNFLIFLVVLYFALRKPVREFWTGRAHRIDFEIGEAARLRKESDDKHRAIRGRLTGIEQEIGLLVKKMETEGDLERKRLMEEADHLAQRMKMEAAKIGDQEVRKARERLKAEAVHLAVEMADRLIRENFSDEDQRRLAEEYVESLKEETA